MITKFKPKMTIPFSLHDIKINDITYKNKFVYLNFFSDFLSAKEPYKQVKGKITIENVDIDSSYVLLLSRLGEFGKFDGSKMTVLEFIGQYDKCCFEIIDEMYGFNQVTYIGYLHLKDDSLIQIALLMYFNGDIVYKIEE